MPVPPGARAYTVPRPPPIVRWVARDRYEDGSLAAFVTVWTERPVRSPLGDGHYWGDGRGGLEGFAESLWPGVALRRFGVYPETDLELIRVERTK